MSPKISVVIPFYNGAKTLNRAVESVMNQSFEDWELILVDDGSTDDSVRRIQDFLLNPKISLVKQVNQGVSAARNFGAAHSKGLYLVFLDADDLIEPSHLEDFKREAIKATDVMTCEMKVFIGGKEKKDSFKNNSAYKPIIPGTWMIKKEIFEELGGFDEQLKFAENTELFFRFDKRKGTRLHIQKKNLNYFQSGSGGSKNLQNMIDSILIILEKHDKYLTDHVKYLYNQIIGVNQLRFHRFEEGRKSLWRAVVLKPYQPKTLLRFGLSCFPLLSKLIYKPL